MLKYKPDSEKLALLQRRFCTQWSPHRLKSGEGVAAHRIKNIVEQIACDAFTQILDNMRVPYTDANLIKTHQEGYDYIVNGKRVQVKGCSAVEQVGWSFKDTEEPAALKFDVFVFVDIGVCLDVTGSRFDKWGWPIKEVVDFYVIPHSIIHDWFKQRRYVNKGRVEIYFNRRPFKEGSKQEKGQYKEILDWRNRFEFI